MLRKLNKELMNNEVIKIDSFSLLVIRKWHKNLEDELNKIDAILLDTRNSNENLIIVSIVRTFTEGLHYLMPIFHLSYDEKSMELLTDGVFERNKSLSKLKNIKNKLDKIELIQFTSYTELVQLRLVQFLYTRNASLTPLKDRNQPLGYYFPLLSLYFPKDPYSIIGLVDDMINKGLVFKTLLDKFQVCSCKKESYLSYKTVCPNCDSINIQTANTVKHIKCNTIGKLSDFYNSNTDSYFCNGCKNSIENLEKEIDLSSIYHECNSCNNLFQSPKLIAECNSCRKLNDLNELNDVKIHSFSLSLEGVFTAQNGRIKKESQQLNNQFETFFNSLEKNISKKNKHNSHLISLNIDSIGMINFNGALKKELWIQFEKEVAMTLKSFDSSYIIEKNRIKILLNEEHISNVSSVINDIKIKLNNILNRNYLDDKLNIHYTIQKI